jgi:serine/threonine protein kinase
MITNTPRTCSIWEIRFNCFIFYLFSLTIAKDVVLCSVLRFASNGSLFDWIHNPDMELPPSLVLSFLRDICAGMAYLHSQNVIHRDLVSKNKKDTSAYF